ncbi:MAG TPA: hemerythrin domain-containing protein [Acidimicrobiales bacterium]|nr:hemerythrin domain-containing protein [Acidimicrobiales bacterium]
MPDPFATLLQDHREVENLFAQFEQSGDHETAIQICRELAVHSMVEEELIYPLFAAKVSKSLAEEARHEHQEAKDIITRIEVMSPDDPGLADAVAELKASVQHHVEEEENDLFPRMAKELPEIVSTLGPDVDARKEVLLERASDHKAQGLAPSASSHKPVATQGSVTGDQPRSEP